MYNDKCARMIVDVVTLSLYSEPQNNSKSCARKLSLL